MIPSLDADFDYNKSMLAAYSDRFLEIYQTFCPQLTLQVLPVTAIKYGSLIDLTPTMFSVFYRPAAAPSPRDARMQRETHNQWTAVYKPHCPRKVFINFCSSGVRALTRRGYDEEAEE